MSIFKDSNLGVNPFCTSLEIQVRKVSTRQYVKDEEHGIMVNNIVLLETTPITKLYATAERRDLVKVLSGTSSKLLLLVMYNLEPGCDHIRIIRKNYMQSLSVKSEITFRTALNELIRYGMLSPTVKQEVYWINPDFFFQGNRVKKYPNHRKIINADDK